MHRSGKPSGIWVRKNLSSFVKTLSSLSFEAHTIWFVFINFLLVVGIRSQSKPNDIMHEVFKAMKLLNYVSFFLSSSFLSCCGKEPSRNPATIMFIFTGMEDCEQLPCESKEEESCHWALCKYIWFLVLLWEAFCTGSILGLNMQTAVNSSISRG